MLTSKIDALEIARAFHLLSSYNGIVRWGARKGDRIQGAWAGSALELVQFAEAYAEWDFYVQLNPSDRRHGVRCSTEDIAAWEWFVVDLDPVGIPDKKSLGIAVQDVKRAVHAYTGKDYIPLEIHSGRGRQLWYRVSDFVNKTETGMRHEWHLKDSAGLPVLFDVRGIDLWAEDPIVVKRNLLLRDVVTCAQRYWLSQLAARITVPNVIVDPSVSDLPRLMRCPGTINQKTGERAYFVTDTVTANLLGAWAVQPYMAWKLLKYTPSDRLYPSAVPDSSALPDGAPWQAALSRVNPTAANFVTYGSTEPGRHRACVAAARALAETGLSEEEVLKALIVGGERSRPELLDVAYLSRTAHEAWIRVNLFVDKPGRFVV